MLFAILYSTHSNSYTGYRYEQINSFYKNFTINIIPVHLYGVIMYVRIKYIYVLNTFRSRFVDVFNFFFFFFVHLVQFWAPIWLFRFTENVEGFIYDSLEISIGIFSDERFRTSVNTNNCNAHPAIISVSRKTHDTLRKFSIKKLKTRSILKAFERRIVMTITIVCRWTRLISNNKCHFMRACVSV